MNRLVEEIMEERAKEVLKWALFDPKVYSRWPHTTIDPERCEHAVHQDFVTYQCNRKPKMEVAGHNFCTQHGKKVLAALQPTKEEEHIAIERIVQGRWSISVHYAPTNHVTVDINSKTQLIFRSEREWYNFLDTLERQGSELGWTYKGKEWAERMATLLGESGGMING